MAEYPEDEQLKKIVEGATDLLTSVIQEGPTAQEEIEKLLKKKNLTDVEKEYLELLKDHVKRHGEEE